MVVVSIVGFNHCADHGTGTTTRMQRSARESSGHTNDVVAERYLGHTAVIRFTTRSYLFTYPVALLATASFPFV